MPAATCRFERPPAIAGWIALSTGGSPTRVSTSSSVIQSNTVNPFLATASLASQVNFDKRFDWGTLNIGGSRSQDLSNDQVTQNFPRVTLTPSPVNLSSAVT